MSAPTAEELQEFFLSEKSRALFMDMTDYSSAAAGSSCWTWLGATNGKGYGRVGRYCNGVQRSEYAHRVAYLLWRGPIPEGMFVCHTCDVRNCVRPEHLWIGSAQDNMDDMDCKGRRIAVGLKGEAHHKAKLTDEMVREIRRLYVRGSTQFGGRALGLLYGVSEQTVARAANGKGWRHLA